jgi:hypothetical protein
LKKDRSITLSISESGTHPNISYRFHAFWRVGLESYAAIYKLCPGISRAERVSFGIRISECLVALLTKRGFSSATVS